MTIIQKHLEFRDDPVIKAGNGNIVDFNSDNATTDWFKVNEKITGQTGKDSTKSVEIIVPLNYPSNIWRNLEMPFINWEINFDLN